MKVKYIVFFFITLAIGLAGYRLNNYRYLTVEKVNVSIGKELPSAATLSEVQFFLDSHGFARGAVAAPDFDSDFQTNLKLNGKRHLVKSMIGGINRNVENDFLVDWDISVKFYFDAEGKLVEYTIKQEGAGM